VSLMTGTETRSKRLIDERVAITQKRESLITEANGRDDGQLTENENDLVTQYRERTDAIDNELEELTRDMEREAASREASKKVRTHLSGQAAGVDQTGEEVLYRSFGSYARDRMIRDIEQIRAKVEIELGPDAVLQAKERLMRAPANTVSADVGGLLPPTHIQQIMDVIDASRPVVASANSVPLTTGNLTWPKITSRPRVRRQGAEKTETSSVRMGVTMESASANTYLGAGNLSWQTINWSTPAALELFFRLCAEAYALATESEACHVLALAASSISPTLAGTTADTFEDWIAAILAGIEEVIEDTNATPDTLYLSRDMFFLAAGVTSDTRQMLITPGQLNLKGLSGQVAGLNVVTSRGFEAGTAIVGDSQALLVGETAGAPVQLQVVEPSIGGVEAGVIGAFKAISFDDGRFADIGPTT